MRLKFPKTLEGFKKVKAHLGNNKVIKKYLRFRQK